MNNPNPETAARRVGKLSDAQVEAQFFDWLHWARANQLPPDGDWTTWVLLGGRGSGKTRAGAEWIRSLARQKVTPIALVGETMTEAIGIMVRGESGILAVHPDEERPVLKGNRLIWPNGVEAAIMTASDPERFRGPQFAAAWCDEFGCGAVDKGANQPNIFGDSKSMESGRPYFSSGKPDALIQRQALRAQQSFWRDPAQNPAGMVDVSRIYLWTWDARPYPAFPALGDVWTDGPNHRNGHWLTGRLGVLASDELARALGAAHGVTLDAEPALPLLHGMVLNTATSAREALEPLCEMTGLGVRNLSGDLHLGLPRRAQVEALDLDELAVDDGPVMSRKRGDPGEAPTRLVLSYLDRERDYQTGTATALIASDGPVTSRALGMTLDGASARMAAERMLDALAPARETLEFALPPTLLHLEPGDLVAPETMQGGPFEIVEIRDGASRRITARSLPMPMATSVEPDRAVSMSAGTFTRVLPDIVVAHLPPLAADPTHTRLVVGCYAQPWPGRVSISDEATHAPVVELTRRAAMGRLTQALVAGPLGMWDRASEVEFDLLGGHLADAAEEAVLGGSNRIAVETDGGGWEVIGFAEAELIAPGRYGLRHLLRGLDGTDAAMGAASPGRRVLVLDGRVASVAVEPHLVGETRYWRAFAGSADLTGTVLTIGTNLNAARPLRPVHVRAVRDVSGDISLSWTRRSRADGDGWGAADAPLEHAPELYRIRIYDGAVLKRQFDVGAPTALYSAAQQTADFGGLPDSFTITVAQVSAVLGEGHAAQGAFHG